MRFRPARGRNGGAAPGHPGQLTRVARRAYARRAAPGHPGQLTRVARRAYASRASGGLGPRRGAMSGWWWSSGRDDDGWSDSQWGQGDPPRQWQWGASSSSASAAGGQADHGDDHDEGDDAAAAGSETQGRKKPRVRGGRATRPGFVGWLARKQGIRVSGLGQPGEGHIPPAERSAEGLRQHKMHLAGRRLLQDRTTDQLEQLLELDSLDTFQGYQGGPVSSSRNGGSCDILLATAANSNGTEELLPSPFLLLSQGDMKKKLAEIGTDPEPPEPAAPEPEPAAKKTKTLTMHVGVTEVSTYTPAETVETGAGPDEPLPPPPAPKEVAEICAGPDEPMPMWPPPPPERQDVAVATGRDAEAGGNFAKTGMGGVNNSLEHVFGIQLYPLGIIR